jgi:hypothetical protein
MLKAREMEEDEKRISLPKVGSSRQVPKYDSPFGIPDDAEVGTLSSIDFQDEIEGEIAKKGGEIEK